MAQTAASLQSRPVLKLQRGRPTLLVRAAANNKSSSTSGKAAAGSKAGSARGSVDYGPTWYEKTREGARPRTVREELEWRRQANLAANNGRERKDLYTDNWDGSEYKGSPWNILTLLAALFILVPVGGLAFAFLTYGELWG